MQAAQHGGDSERQKSRELSVVEKFNEDERRDIATCNENSAACFSKIRDTKTIFICCRGMQNLLFCIG